MFGFLIADGSDEGDVEGFAIIGYQLPLSYVREFRSFPCGPWKIEFREHVGDAAASFLNRPQARCTIGEESPLEEFGILGIAGHAVPGFPPEVG
jgi:hypothetical protein